MFTATLTPQPDGSLLISHPDIWEQKMAACRRSVVANIRGRRVEIFVGMIEAKFNFVKVPLWYVNDYADAAENDERTGQLVVVSDPEACIRWIKAYIPRGVEQDRLLEFYSWFHLPTYWKAKQEQAERELATWEEDRRIERQLWFAREEARLNAEAAALTEEPVSTGNKFHDDEEGSP